MRILYAGLGLTLVIWIFSYFKEGLIDPVNAVVVSMFPSMNNLVALFITWLAILLLCVLFFAVISPLFHRRGGGIGG